MKKVVIHLLILAVYVFVIPCKGQVINTFAGNGTAGFSGDGGPAATAELYWPFGVCSDAFGNIYIADNYNCRIRKVNTSGIISTFAGNGIAGYSGDGSPATAAEINTPYGVCADAAGNIYIADYGNDVIRKINTLGRISTFAGTGISGFSGDGGQATAAELYYTCGVCSDASGNIYIADWGNHRIRKVNTSGIISTFAGNGTVGYSGDGGAATAAELYAANIYADASGKVYIADEDNYRVRIVNTSGIINTFAGTGTEGYTGDGGQATSAEISKPMGISSDASGNIYIADWVNNVIRKVSTSGIINTFAGDGTSGYSGDGGVATAAELDLPIAVCCNASGNIYVSDYANNRVRIVGSVASVNEIMAEHEEVIVYPNPSNGKFAVEIKNEKLKINSVVEVYNMLGQKVYSQSFLIPNSQFLINISSQPSGLYLYRLIDESGAVIGEGKLIKE